MMMVIVADGLNIMPVKLRQVLICHGLKLFCIAVKMKMLIHAGNVCDFIGNRADIMGDKNERNAFFTIQFLQQLVKPFNCFLIDSNRRLVKNEQLRFAHQRSRDESSLLLSSESSPMFLSFRDVMPTASIASSTFCLSALDMRLNKPSFAVKPLATTS